MRPLDRRLLPYLLSARAALAGVVTTGVAAAALVVAQAFVVGGLVTALVHGDDTQRARWALGVVVVLSLRGIIGWLGDSFAARASARVVADLRRRVLTVALSRRSDVAGGAGVGELTLLATRGVTQVDPYLTRYLPSLLLAGVLPPLTVVAIATQDLLSAVVVLATLPLVPVFAILIGLATRDRADRQWRAMSTLANQYLDIMRGLPTLAAYGQAAAQAKTIRRVTERYRRATMDTLKVAFASSAALEMVATLSVALVAVEVGLRLRSGNLDLQTSLVVLLLAPEAYWPLRRVGAEFHAAAEGVATFEQVDDLLAAEPEPLDSLDAAPLRPRGAIRVAGVSLTYPGRTDPSLGVLDATIPANGLCAVAGPSGGGKSTLLSVLAGLLTPTTGQVLVDGTPVTAANVEAWQRSVAYVPQQPWLLPGTVRDNVLLARPDADDQEIWAALARVELADVVRERGGLDAVVGEDGARFSAGQRARLVLARAVIADRPVVLLDEPTAHLDAVTEAVIVATLKWLAERATVVVVAHRQAILDLADSRVEVCAPATQRRAAASIVPLPAQPDLPDGVTDGPPATPATESAQPRGKLRLVGANVLGALSSAAGVALTATSGWLIVRAAEQPPVLMLMVAIVGVRTFGIARPMLRYAERLVSHDAVLRMLGERRARVYDDLVPLVPGGLGRRRGDVLSSVVDDVDAVTDEQLRVRAPLFTFVAVGALAVLTAALLLPAAGALVALLLVVAGGLALVVPLWAASRAERVVVAARSTMSDQVTGFLQGAQELTMWQASPRAVAAVDVTETVMSRATERSARGAATARLVVLSATGLALVLLAEALVEPVESGGLRGPLAALLLLLPLPLLDVLLPLDAVGALRVRSRAAAERLDQLGRQEPLVHDPAEPASVTGAAALTAHGLTAAWDGPPIFTGLDLDLPPGTRLGVTGTSGSGKSTLAALLVRFLDPVAGEIRLGTTGLRDLTLAEVRRHVSLVDDTPYVFSTTVAENLRLGRPGATDADIEAVLTTTRLGGWLADLPDGVATMVGEGHLSVSGGERARLGLARALLADSEVLVLDEPTAHLDHATATEVTTDLLAASSGRAVVWVTHGHVGLDAMDAVIHLGEPVDRPGPRGSSTGPLCPVESGSPRAQ